MLKLALAVVALLFVALPVTACGGGGGAGAAKTAGGGGGAAQNVTVKAQDTMKFEPATLTVRSGSAVNLTLDNSGALVHDWVVENLGGSKVAVEAAGGSKASASFTPSTTGNVQFYCSQPGHKEAGMTGSLTIQ